MEITLSENIKKFRKRKGLSQSELANEINISLQSMWRIENGKGYPRIENLVRIAEVLEVELPVLFEDDSKVTDSESSLLKNNSETKIGETLEGGDFISKDIGMDDYNLIFKKFKENMRSARLKKKLTQKELADMLGINKRTILNYENGNTYPNPSQMCSIATVLEVPLETLVSDNTDTSKILQTVGHIDEKEIFMDNKKIVGKNLKKIRKERGMTQKEFADFLDMGVQNLSQAERGVYKPGLDKLTDIAKKLKLTPNDLLLDSESSDILKSVDDKLKDAISKIIVQMETWEPIREAASIARQDGDEESEKRLLMKLVNQLAPTNDDWRDIADFIYFKKLNEKIGLKREPL